MKIKLRSTKLIEWFIQCSSNCNIRQYPDNVLIKFFITFHQRLLLIYFRALRYVVLDHRPKNLILLIFKRKVLNLEEEGDIRNIRKMLLLELYLDLILTALVFFLLLLLCLWLNIGGGLPHIAKIINF